MKKTILLLMVIVALTGCKMMEPTNNYKGAIVTDRVKMKFNGRLIIVKYNDANKGRWVYKRVWISNFEYQNLKTGDTIK